MKFPSNNILKCPLCSGALKYKKCFNCYRFMFSLNDTIFIWINPCNNNSKYKIWEAPDYLIYKCNGLIAYNDANFNGWKYTSNISFIKKISDTFDHMNKIMVFK